MARTIYFPRGWTVSADSRPGPILLTRAADALKGLDRLADTMRHATIPGMLLWTAWIGPTAMRPARSYPAAADALAVIGQRHGFVVTAENVKTVTKEALAECERLQDGIPIEKKG